MCLAVNGAQRPKLRRRSAVRHGRHHLGATNHDQGGGLRSDSSLAAPVDMVPRHATKRREPVSPSVPPHGPCGRLSPPRSLLHDSPPEKSRRNRPELVSGSCPFAWRREARHRRVALDPLGQLVQLVSTTGSRDPAQPRDAALAVDRAGHPMTAACARTRIAATFSRGAGRSRCAGSAGSLLRRPKT